MRNVQFKHTAGEAFFKYDAKVTLCSNGHWKGKIYKESVKKMRDGFEKELPSRVTLECEEQDKIKNRLGRKAHEDKKEKEFRADSLNRTRDTLIEYASENEHIWKSFITLTYAENVQDIDKGYKDFKTWVRQIRRKMPDFQYLCVPEFQKRGAIHFHAITNAECGELWETKTPIMTFNSEKNRIYALYWYDLPYWKHGYSTAEDLRIFDDQFNVALRPET